MNPVMLFEPDGYMLDGPKLMGRQAAGDGFLRAAVKAHGGHPLVAFTPHKTSADVFRTRVLELDPTAKVQWLPSLRLDQIARFGTFYRPDHAIDISAAMRLRVGLGRYSICGVTHTLCSANAIEIITRLSQAPITPWDAIVCTSTVGRQVVVSLMDAQDEYLAWRFKQPISAPRPQLPVIPLGVHPEDFATSPEMKARARAEIGLADDEVVGLFAGRLTFSSKAHPYPMYAALQEVAKSTGKRLVLLHAGQFHNPEVEQVFRQAAAAACPDVRCVFVNGKDPETYALGWRAADVFISLSDNIQETFGITPLEAMASGLPVLVTDWDGYKDTVRDGVDGFRIPTWQPGPGLGASVAQAFETGALNYDYYIHRTSLDVALDMRLLVSRLIDLVTRPELRQQMGAAGRTRVLELFDWSVVYRRYQELWTELGRIRAIEAPTWPTAPTASPKWPDPFTLFAHYPTAVIDALTPIRTAPGASVARYEALTSIAILGTWKSPSDTIARVLAEAEAPDATVGGLASRLNAPLSDVAELVARLAKMELLHLPPAP